MNMLLRTVLPGTVVGIFVISVSLLLLCIARRMGNLIRVGTDRNEGAQGEVQSVSEDATVNGIEEENLSVYELVERGNNAHLTELRQTVTNPNYQREGNLVLQDFSHAIRHPNDNEIIYAEPFPPLPVQSGNDTSLTSLTGSGGASSQDTTSNTYQSLIGKSAESVLYASRYSVPEQLGQGPSNKCTDQAFLKAPSISGDLPCTTEVLSDTERYSETQQSEPVPFFNGPRQERLIGASVGHHSSTNVDDLPNMERKARYRLKDVFVEDLEIETRGTNNPFQEISISPSVLLGDTAKTGNRDCENIQHGHVNAIKEHFNALAQLSQETRPQKRNTESVEDAQCFNDLASSESKFSPQEKLQAFFKMTL
ncbi:hypothetical protein ABFA07_012418 [Porites harrisoni]